MRIVESTDVETIRPLYDEWLKIANGAEWGVELDPDVTSANMQKLVEADGVLLVAYEDDQPTGFFAISKIPSTFGKQWIAVEAMWFALPNAHMAGPSLLKAAQRWTASHGCCHQKRCHQANAFRRRRESKDCGRGCRRIRS